jgi:hypothetical protein
MCMPLLAAATATVRGFQAVLQLLNILLDRSLPYTAELLNGAFIGIQKPGGGPVIVEVWHCLAGLCAMKGFAAGIGWGSTPPKWPWACQEEVAVVATPFIWACLPMQIASLSRMTSATPLTPSAETLRLPQSARVPLPSSLF